MDKKLDYITITKTEYESLIAARAVLNAIYYDTLNSNYPVKEEIIRAVDSLQYLINHKPVEKDKRSSDAPIHIGGKKK